MSELHHLSVAELARKLRAREVSAVETAQHFLARGQAHAGLGAFLATDEAVTLAQRCLGLATPSEVRTVVVEYMSRRFPQHFSS